MKQYILAIVVLIILSLDAKASRDPIQGDLLEEAAATGNFQDAINPYTYVGGDPINNVDPFGLATIANNTGGALIVSGNVGSSHGTGGQSYGFVPSNGKTYGGNNSVTGYSSAEAAFAASRGQSIVPYRIDGDIRDIDSYATGSTAGSCPPAGKDGFLNNRVKGDEQGPNVTVGKDADGNITESISGNTGAYIRRGWEKVKELF